METLARAANRGSVSTGYDIDNSLKFEPDNSENMYRALNASTSTTTFTHSQWVKRTEIGGSQLLYLRGVAGNESVVLRFATENASYPEALQVDIGASGTNSRSYTKAAFRDTAAFYHIVLAVDTTQATATDRFKLYVNGVLEDDYAARANPTQNFAMEVSSAKHRYGAYNDTDNYAPFAGYLAECHYIDGSQLAPTDFGEFDEDSGIWKPKAYAGSYGTGGYYLDFEASGDLGANTEGDDVNFTLRNIAAADQATDTPTNNFATFNVLQNQEGSFVFTEGATTFNTTTPNQFRTNLASIAVTNGKWYAEFSGAFSNNSFCGVGVMDQVNSLETSHLGAQANTTAQGMGYYSDNGYFYRNAGSGAWGDSYTTDDIIGVALDYRSDGTAHMYVAKNGTWQNSSDPATDTNPLSLNFGSAFAAGTFLAIGASIYDNDGAVTCNFGGYTTFTISSPASDANGYGTFEYAPPSGYYALCTKNLAEFG